MKGPRIFLLVILLIYAIGGIGEIIRCQEPPEPTEPTVTEYIAQWAWGPLAGAVWKDTPILSKNIYPVPGTRYETMPTVAEHIFWHDADDPVAFVFEAADSKPEAQKVVEVTIQPAKDPSAPWRLGWFGRARFAGKLNAQVGPWSEASYWLGVIRIPLTGKAIHIIVPT